MSLAVPHNNQISETASRCFRCMKRGQVDEDRWTNLAALSGSVIRAREKVLEFGCDRELGWAGPGPNAVVCTPTTRSVQHENCLSQAIVCRTRKKGRIEVSPVVASPEVVPSIVVQHHHPVTHSAQLSERSAAPTWHSTRPDALHPGKWVSGR